MSLLDVIGRFRTATSYTVTRAGAGTYTAGRYVAASPSTFTITASVQPVTGRELLALPEGQRAEDLRVLYTATALRTRDANGAADSIAIGGENYTVIRVETWSGVTAGHYRVTVARQTAGATP